MEMDIISPVQQVISAFRSAKKIRSGGILTHCAVYPPRTSFSAQIWPAMYEVSSCYSLIVRERHFQLCRVTISHRGRVTHICVSKLCHHWFRQWLGAWSAPSHYLNQYSNSVNSNLRKNLGEILSKFHTLSFKKMHFEMSAKWRQFYLGINVITHQWPS